MLKWFDDSWVRHCIYRNPKKYLDYLKQRVTDIACGEAVWIKPKIIYPDPIHPNDGDIRPMTCFTSKVKVIKIIATNPIRKKHHSISVGTTILLDYAENYPIAAFDACALSAIRTAALTIIATEFAGFDFSDIGIVGMGEVGTAASLFLASYKNYPRCYDIKTGYCPGTVINHRVVIAATNSKHAFLHENNCQADFIVSVGADTAFNHELDPFFIDVRQGLYVDVVDAFAIGDLALLPQAATRCEGDLIALCQSGAGRARTLISVGSPLMDALTVEFLCAMDVKPATMTLGEITHIVSSHI